jgi:hypothetical protein
LREDIYLHWGLVFVFAGVCELSFTTLLHMDQDRFGSVTGDDGYLQDFRSTADAGFRQREKRRR